MALCSVVQIATHHAPVFVTRHVSPGPFRDEPFSNAYIVVLRLFKA